MALESGSYINSLNAANPASTDGLAQADDHLRLLKSTITGTFPNIDAPVTVTPSEMNLLSGMTGLFSGFSIQDGDGTNVTMPNDGRIKFVEGPGIDVNFTDTSPGSTADPFDLAIGLKVDRRHSANADVWTGNTSDYIWFDANVGMRFYTAGAEDMRLTDGGTLHVDADIVAYSSTISDERLKTDIAPITDALSKVQQLNGYTFTYMADNRASAGVIAQEVEHVLPSAVTEQELVFQGTDGESYKTVQYDQLHGLLIEAIKELKAEIEELKSNGG